MTRHKEVVFAAHPSYQRLTRAPEQPALRSLRLLGIIGYIAQVDASCPPRLIWFAGTTCLS